MRYNIMNIFYSTVFVFPFICAANTNVVLDGEMSFDVKIVNYNNGKTYKNQVLQESLHNATMNQLKSSKQDKERLSDSKQGSSKRTMKNLKMKEKDRNTFKGSKEREVQEIKQKGNKRKAFTKAAQLECIYQYPERNHMEVLLSDMMNQLTRLIVSAHEYSESDLNNLNKVGETSKEGEEGEVGEVGEVSDVSDGRRSDKRFRVVNDRSPSVFETIFKQLVHDFQNFYNRTIQNINQTKDPCDNQAGIKKLWQYLLSQSQQMLRRSTLRAVERRFPRTRADDLGNKEIKRMLDAELVKMRSEQLDSLCDIFQLCYNDLL